MISSIIIDDEQNSVDVLEKLINRFFRDQVEIVSEFNNLNDAVQYLNGNSVDLYSGHETRLQLRFRSLIPI